MALKRIATMSDIEVSLERHAIRPTSGNLTYRDRWVHIKARLGINRSGHRIEPGLYALGNPSQDSPVFGSANYALSFDALRTALQGTNCYILVLDTKGINVWCAAGKGTFGTDELVRRIELTGLREITDRRKLIVPQLGAPGVAAHVVKKRSGFTVEYGPVRVKDLPEYLKTHTATEEMRRVKFTLHDRLLLIPVELVVNQILLSALLGVLFYFIGGLHIALGAIAAIFTGLALFPVLLPWIPTTNFSTKGSILGVLVALPFILVWLIGDTDAALWQRIGWALTHLLVATSITAFLALNFTGSTTFTSRSGVKREIFAYIPILALMFGGGLILSVTLRLIQVFGD